MSDGLTGSARRLELVEVIHRIRNRWRMRLAMRGALVVIAGTLLALLVSASGLEALRFSPNAIVAFRVGALVIFAGLVYLALVRPLRRRVSDSQVAMYLEEGNPALQAAIISAVEAAEMAGDDSPTGPSPKLVEKLVEQAIDQCRAVDTGLGIERKRVQTSAMALGAVLAAAALVLVFGPAFLRQGFSAMLIMSRSAEASSPYHIDVKPGNSKVPRGSDQSVTAKLLGFTAKEANLMVSAAPGAAFERVPLLPGKDPAGFEGTLFHVDKTASYYVEANGVKSPVYSMTVVDLPTVDKLVLEYRFPSYTGLEPRTVDPGGDIAVMPGTQVSLKISPTMATSGGLVHLNETESSALTVQSDGTLAGNFTVSKQGFYQIELNGPHGEKVTASPQYTIDILNDMDPTISFTKPGRDTSATTVEEVFAEVKADDDFGIKQVQMFYSVNGGAEKTINLFSGAKALPEVTASHTLYLEEMGLKPGDFVSYYAKAMDNDGVAGSKTTTSDVYFVEIRPFRKDYKPAQSAAGGGGGGGGGRGGQQNEVGQLSRQQKEIYAATFNVNRDRAAKKMKDDKFRENAALIQLRQARLREQVEELSGKMNSRLDVVDPALKTIADALPKAIAEMKAAEGELSKQKTQEAISPEGRALKLLQDAEQQYEVQVQAQRGGGGGGGGGGSQQMAQDLADLFELELDKLASQYELQQRADTQQGDQKTDELADKLKELARRQQQEVERQQRLAALGQAGGGSSDNQRQLAQELEDAARRLEQLQRDQPRAQQNMADAARQLRDAANAMRQSAANGSRDGGAQAQQALERLQQAQRMLQQNQGGRLDRDIADAQKRAQDLQAQAKAMQNDSANLSQSANRQEKATQLADRKDEFGKNVDNLKDSIERLANQARNGKQAQTARKLDEAAGAVDDKQVAAAARYTAKQLRAGQASDRNVENMIPSGMDDVNKKLADAQAAMGQASKQDAAQQAADRAGNMARGLQSAQAKLDEMRRQAQQGAQGQQGQNGQQGQQGQNGQQGQQGQQGQNGQQGQQGRSGQQGQGQQGQQGQGGQGQQAGQQGQQGQGQGQGQGQQQAQNGQGGNRGGNNNGGGARNGGDWNGGYGANWGGNWNGVWTDDVRRQFERTAQEWQNDLRNLQRDLNQAGIQPRDLQDVQRLMNQLATREAFVDPQNLQALLAAAADKMKQAEFDIRKKADGDDQPLALSASDDAPANQKTLVEEYYRAIAKKQ